MPSFIIYYWLFFLSNAIYIKFNTSENKFERHFCQVYKVTKFILHDSALKQKENVCTKIFLDLQTLYIANHFELANSGNESALMPRGFQIYIL